MKKLFGLFLIVALTACQQPKTEAPPVEEETSNSIIDVAKLSGVGSNTQLSLDLVDFGTTDATSRRVVKNLIIQNTSSSKINMNIVPMSVTSGFTVLKNSFCSKTLEAKASCNLSVQFNNTGLYDGTYTDGVMVTIGSNSTTVQFKAVVLGNPYGNTDNGIDKLLLTLDSPFNLRGNSYRTLTISNVGTATSVNLDQVVPYGYSIRLNRCPTILIAGSSCVMQIIYQNYLAVIDPPVGSMSVSSTTASTSINLVTGLSNFINNDNIFTNIFAFPKLINYQSGFSMVHYQGNIQVIKKNNYKIIILGE